MQTTIVARVAEFIRDPEARKAIDKSAGKQAPQMRDQITLSEEGRRKSEEIGKVSSDWEKSRMERVNAVQDKVQKQSYRFSPEIVDQVAARIVYLM